MKQKTLVEGWLRARYLGGRQHLGGRGSPAEGGGLPAEALSPLIAAAFASSCSLSIIPLGSLHGIYLKFNHFNI